MYVRANPFQGTDDSIYRDWRPLHITRVTFTRGGMPERQRGVLTAMLTTTSLNSGLRPSNVSLANVPFRLIGEAN